MAAKEWAIPLLLAVLTAGGLAFVHVVHPAKAPPGAPDAVFPFSQGARAGPGDLTFLLVAPHGRAKAEAALNASGDAEVHWRTDRLALVTVPAEPTSFAPRPCPCIPWPRATVAGAPGPLLRRDGYNATTFTAYVFDEGGSLVASNAPAADQARFTRSPDFRDLPGGAWYLGDNSTPPPGTVDPPPLAGAIVVRLLDQLDGLPEGGVASDTSNAFVAMYGTLFVTVRIDHLVHAP